MTLSLRIAGSIASCGILVWVAIGARGPVADDKFLLELPLSANIRSVEVRGNAAYVRVAKAIRTPEGAPGFELEELEFPLITGEEVAVASPATVEVSGGNSKTEQRAQPSSGDAIDWREWIIDTMDGLASVSFSADGQRFLTVVRQGNGIASANVTTWLTEPSLTAGSMTSVDRLLHASISSDGSLIYIQTTDGLFIHAFESFGEADPLQEISASGESRKIFKRVESTGEVEAKFFFLVGELSVDLYAANRPRMQNGELAALKPLATLRTNDYAIAAQFDIESRLMIVVEHDRARVAKVSEIGREVLAEHLLETGVEFRSCEAFHLESEQSPSGSALWALGLRQKVVRPTKQQAGKAEFAVLILALEEGSKRLAVLSVPIWKTCERWNQYSPRIQFNEDATELIAYTRDKAWAIEVPR